MCCPERFANTQGHYLSRPAVLEDEATARAIRLARFVDVPIYVVHVMSGGAAEEVARARNYGQRVVGEAVIQGIACDESQVRHPDFKVAAQYVMSPPIRRREVDGAMLKSMLDELLLVAASSTQRRCASYMLTLRKRLELCHGLLGWYGRQRRNM